jgi:hypothetical protein
MQLDTTTDSSLEAEYNETPRVIFCNLKAIEAAERPRYNDLVKRIRAAIRERNSREDGYAYQLDGTGISLPEVAEWMSMERLCCPFLTIQVSAVGNQEDWALTLTGPIGVKSLLDLEFPIRK